MWKIEKKLDEAIVQKYILPTRRKRRPYVGVEFELPIVNMDKKPVDFTLVHQLTGVFIRHFSFTYVINDDKGDIYWAQSQENGDSLSYDCSYNTLELSFGVESDLNILYGRFREYYSFIQSFLKPYNHTLTGMGINPHFQINCSEPIPNGRYRMLFHHLSSYRNYGDAIPFHCHPNFGMFSCASQVQLDVEEDTLVQTLNTFTILEPLKTLLFANSLWGERHELLCGRDQFWKNSLHGLNRHNVDMYDIKFQSTDEIIAYIKSMSIYCVERGDQYINFTPTPLLQYFKSEWITGEYFDRDGYRKITFRPEIEDIKYLRSFKWEDLTYRGTVEFRSVCAQPVREIMGPAAFHTGLMENLSALTERLQSDHVLYRYGYSASELRQILNQREFPEFLDRGQISDLLIDVLDIAQDGLIKRNRGEEKFLKFLYDRAQSLISPARQMADGLEAGMPLELFIEEYAAMGEEL